MGAPGAGAPDPPELPAAANLPLVHPIALIPHVCYLDDNVGHVYRFDDPAPGSPHWTYLGSIRARTVDKFGKSKEFQVAHAERGAYLGTRRAPLFRMDLRTGRATGPVDLTKLDASFKGFQ